MGDVVNLRKARKAKAREQAQADATANRARTGRTKAERDAEQLQRDQARRLLDGAKLPDFEMPDA